MGALTDNLQRFRHLRNLAILDADQASASKQGSESENPYGPNQGALHPAAGLEADAEGKQKQSRGLKMAFDV